MADVRPFPASSAAGAPPPETKARKPRRKPGTRARRDRLVRDIANYIGDLADTIELHTSGDVDDSAVSMLHALALRQGELCCGILRLSDVEGSEVVDEVEALLKGPTWARKQ